MGNPMIDNARQTAHISVDEQERAAVHLHNALGNSDLDVIRDEICSAMRWLGMVGTVPWADEL